MDPFDKQLERAQYQYDNMDDGDDDTEDDIPNVWEDIEDEEAEDERFWRKHG